MAREILIVYHDKCQDGLTAAAICNRVFSPNPNLNLTFLPCNYREEDYKQVLDKILTLSTDAEIFIVDFCLPVNWLTQIPSTLALTIIDHHDDKMRKEVKDWVENVADYPELEFVFDPSQSGAGLTWDYFYSMKARPHFVNLIEDRDIWKFKYGDETKQLNLALKQVPQTVQDYTSILNDQKQVVNLIDNGFYLLAHENAILENLATSAYKLPAGLVVCNCPQRFASDLGHNLLNKFSVPISFTYEIGESGIKGSFRSNNGSAQKYAEALGGGGHPNAAGCRIDHYNVQKLLDDLNWFYNVDKTLNTDTANP